MWLQVLNTYFCLRSHLRSCCIHWCLTALGWKNNQWFNALNRYILLLSTHFKLPAQPPIFSDIVLMYRILCFEKPPDNNGLLPLTQCLAQPCQKKKKKKKKRNLQFPGRAWRRILPAREAGSAQFKSEPAAASLTKCEMWMVFLSWCVSQLTHPPSPHHYKLGMGRPIMTCGLRFTRLDVEGRPWC